MDEKHDELKGARGWTTSHRRSVSWLLLDRRVRGRRAAQLLPQRRRRRRTRRSPRRQLQVGWLGEPAVPVFMDSWCGAEAMATEELTEVQEMLEAAKAMGHRVDAEAAPQPGGWRPLSALYRIGANGERIWLSTTFDVDSIAPSRRPRAPTTSARTSPPELQSRFSSLEAVPHEGGPPARTVSVSPVAGTLALFDSVTVPHEVMAVTSGARVPMAGWFPRGAAPASRRLRRERGSQNHRSRGFQRFADRNPSPSCSMPSIVGGSSRPGSALQNREICLLDGRRGHRPIPP